MPAETGLTLEEVTADPTLRPGQPALLQGQLTGPERDELLAHLAASDDDYEVFNEAVEILAAVEAPAAPAAAAVEPATVFPLPQRQRP